MDKADMIWVLQWIHRYNIGNGHHNLREEISRLQKEVRDDNLAHEEALNELHGALGQD